MSNSNSDPRQTAPPYASLRAMGEAASAATGATPAANGAGKPAADPGYWRQEAEKVDVLVQTLWAGFLDAEANGLPTALAEYVNAYAGAMRLRLTLMEYAAVPNRAFKTTATINGKTRTP